MKKNSGQELWSKAKKLIPGGNSLLSKRPEMYLPEIWPAYYKNAKGCVITDLDDNKYHDMSVMGLGTNVLGYANDEIDQEVIAAVRDGNMSTLNCPEEVYLAEKLISMHDWSSMVRFARTGGEANAIAVRIARCFSKKDNIAICGYHGWHDWYLSANLSTSKNLDQHLLPGLNPVGVPSNLKNTVFTFNYNDFEALCKIVKENDIGIIKMEVVRNEMPKDNFLQKVRELASENSIVLIFDECTSGFRETFGGLHKKYDVEPDIAIYGKALGNGYPITAVLGKESIMQESQSSFISSTFWTEKIGYVAALKTLEVMEREKSWEKVTKIGKTITSKWKELASEFSLDISINGIPALSNFSFESDRFFQYKTFISQEMLKRGFLASNVIYCSTKHEQKIVSKYYDALKEVFSQIKEFEDGKDMSSMLDGPECHQGFKRLN